MLYRAELSTCKPLSDPVAAMVLVLVAIVKLGLEPIVRLVLFIVKEEPVCSGQPNLPSLKS